MGEIFRLCVGRIGKTLCCLNDPDEIPDPPTPPQHYRWPWFVLGAFVVAVILAVLWMTAEVRRQESYRQLDTPEFPQGTNATK